MILGYIIGNETNATLWEAVTKMMPLKEVAVFVATFEEESALISGLTELPAEQIFKAAGRVINELATRIFPSGRWPTGKSA